ncbi:MAG: hypothetical protein P8Y66_03495 [Nitrospirota bacterium]|jgi:hypothetical protein
MKKVLAVLAAVAVLGVGATAFANWAGGPGSGYMGGYGIMGSGPGYMGGYGHMMGYGPGYGHMMGYGYGPGYGVDQKTLQETADLRQEIQSKQLEYSEALKAGNEKKADKLARELNDLTQKFSATAPTAAYGYGWGCF